MKKKILKIVFAALLFCNFNFILHADWFSDVLIWSAETFANCCEKGEEPGFSHCTDWTDPELVGGISLAVPSVVIVSVFGCLIYEKVERCCKKRRVIPTDVEYDSQSSARVPEEAV
jgi:hypothetical protein